MNDVEENILVIVERISNTQWDRLMAHVEEEIQGLEKNGGLTEWSEDLHFMLSELKSNRKRMIEMRRSS